LKIRLGERARRRREYKPVKCALDELIRKKQSNVNVKLALPDRNGNKIQLTSRPQKATGSPGNPRMQTGNSITSSETQVTNEFPKLLSALSNPTDR
jgi:hypothetical protein